MIYISALLLGLFGSLHCAGMCGPIALSIPLSNKKFSTKFTGAFIYNAGRILTYSLLGLLFGLMGSGLAMFGFQKIVSVFAGVFMLAAGVYLAFVGNFAILEKLNIFNRPVIRKFWSKLFSQRSFLSLFMIGIFNGLLPCGLVYLALSGALYTGNIYQGTLYMFCFGIGTVPMLLTIVLAGNYLSAKFRAKLYKIVPYYIILIGLLMILRGMGLGIPYLSPAENKLTPAKQTEKEMSKGDCCKKKN